MGNSGSSIADHPLNEAKKNKWNSYFRKLELGMCTVHDKVPKTGWQALHFAAWGASADVVSRLIKAGANVECQDDKGRTPLFKAVRKNNPEAARRLLKHGANINARDYQGDTPLHFAVEKGELDFINLLHEHGADLDAKNHIGWTPLHVTCLLHRAECAMKLVDLGADLYAKTNNNTMAIDIAENCGCYKVALWLADKMSTSKAERTLAVDHSSSVLSGRSTAAASSPGASPTKFVTSKFVIDALPAANATQEAEAVARITKELEPIFDNLKCSHLLRAAAMWCVQQGAETLQDVASDETCVIDLADVIDLPRLKRNKFITEMTGHAPQLQYGE